ncbi:MAG: hypothetical protein KC468_24985, partial [Myxococcales bacterium]|nr:hypothetical protein [Myxococcales bacterium]
WTYGLDGALLGVPREDTFAALDRDALGLVEVAAERRHGFLWACLEGPVDVRAHLGPALDDDLAGFGLAEHARVGSREHDVRANWKLLMDAFAEGYHVRSLHRDSLARYFLEVSLTDDLNPHVRHVGARASFRDAEVPDIRRDTTPFYNLFPNSILVLHPNSISWVTLQPEGVGRTRFVHRMLARPGDADAAALERSFAFIDEQVFAREDLATAESIQRALATGANDHVLLGAQEEGMRLFHRNRDRAIARELETSRESG